MKPVRSVEPWQDEGAASGAHDGTKNQSADFSGARLTVVSRRADIDPSERREAANDGASQPTVDTRPTSQGAPTLAVQSPLGRVAARPPRAHFLVLQKWQGIVQEIGAESIKAHLTDLTTPGSAEEIADIPLAEISPSDSALIAPGAVFYWSVGYEDTVEGPRSRKSLIRFRRLPAWTEREIEQAQREAARLRSALEWE